RGGGLGVARAGRESDGESSRARAAAEPRAVARVAFRRDGDGGDAGGRSTSGPARRRAPAAAGARGLRRRAPPRRPAVPADEPRRSRLLSLSRACARPHPPPRGWASLASPPPLTPPRGPC